MFWSGWRSRGGLPKVIVSDNGSEFTGKVLDAWSNRRGIKLHFIDPGRPMQNAFIESFNGKFRDELLDQNWFTDLSDAKEKIESWRQSYNTVRPHSSLNDNTPAEFASRFEEQKSNENPLVQLVQKRGAGQPRKWQLFARGLQSVQFSSEISRVELVWFQGTG